MPKLLGVPTFQIYSLPGGGGQWPNNLLRDSFQSTNERRTLREDRTASAPAQVDIGTSEVTYYSPIGGLNNLTTADFNRLLAEIQIPSFTADQLPEGQRFVVSIEGRATGGSFNPVATATIQGTGENTEPVTIQYRPSVGSTVADLRASVARVGGTGEKSAQLELRVFYAADQIRTVRYMTGHIVVTSVSTVSAAYEQFIGQDFVTGPVVYLGDGAGGTRAQSFGGAWVILRSDVTDNQNATSMVRVSMEQRGEWRDV